MAIRVATPLPNSIIEKRQKAKEKKVNPSTSSQWRFYLRTNKLR